MSGNRTGASAKPTEADLWGDPVKPQLPRRKPARRTDGIGWCVAVREATSTEYHYVGRYDSEGSAWQAIRDGVGLKPREDREEMHLGVYFGPRRWPR